jgi:hypothetical protein
VLPRVGGTTRLGRPGHDARLVVPTRVRLVRRCLRRRSVGNWVGVQPAIVFTFAFLALVILALVVAKNRRDRAADRTPTDRTP